MPTGGAFSSARSAVSSWFTSITNDWRHDEEEGEEEMKEVDEEKEKAAENGVGSEKPRDS